MGAWALSASTASFNFHRDGITPEFNSRSSLALGETKELIEIHTDRGMDLEDAELVTDIISKNENAWINIMMVEELGIVEDNASPLNVGGHDNSLVGS